MVEVMLGSNFFKLVRGLHSAVALAFLIKSKNETTVFF